MTDLADLLTSAGIDDVDLTEAADDEHVRYAAYVRVLGTTEPPADHDVIVRVLRDPDQAMAHAVVVRHIDRMATTLRSLAVFSAWSSGTLTLLDDQDFATQRIGEWLVYRSVVDGSSSDPARALAGSDWLQRKLAADAPTGTVLSALAERGRTKRVRHVARTRAR